MTHVLDARSGLRGELPTPRGYVRKRQRSVGGKQWWEWPEPAPPTLHPVVDPFFCEVKPLQTFTYGAPGSPKEGDPSLPFVSFFHARCYEGREERRYQDAYVAALELDDGRRARLGHLGWLILERDAMLRQLERGSERLTSPRSGVDRAPLLGALAVLKVWRLEAEVSVLGGGWHEIDWATLSDAKKERAETAVWAMNELWRAVATGVRAERMFKQGGSWHPFLHVADLQDEFVEEVVDGLSHYLRQRDSIIEGVASLYSRWIAAEAVLHWALSGRPFDIGWAERADAEATEQELMLWRRGYAVILRPMMRQLRIHRRAGASYEEVAEQLGDWMDEVHGDLLRARGLDPSNFGVRKLREMRKLAREMGISIDGSGEIDGVDGSG